MANCGFSLITLIEKVFDFHFYSADTVRFIPVQLGIKLFAVIKKSDAGKTFQLTPTPIAISFPQPFEVTNTASDSNRFDAFNFADDFK